MAEKTILVADDAPSILRVVQMGFEALDYRVLTAIDGEQALALVRAERPDLVILDVMMPKMNGYDVCAEIKRDPQLRTIPVVMLTAKNLDEDKYWGRELGADEYVTKPYDPEELERVVERIFAFRERGETYHPLTKLPDWNSVRHETERRRREGIPFVMQGCRLAAEAAETYRMKYGNIKADDVTLELSQLVATEVAAVDGGRGFVGHGGDDVLYVVVSPAAAPAVREAIERGFLAAVPNYYCAEDAERGCILRPGDAADGGVPLLSLVWREMERFPAA